MRIKTVKWCDRSVITAPYFCLCKTEAQFHAELKRMDVPSDQWPEFVIPGADATTHYFTKPDGKTACIVTLSGHAEREPIAVAGLLVHEAVHIWQQTRDAMRETSPGREIEAYSIQWIAQQLMWSYTDSLTH